tara:strand:+ start:37 stop:876 length:840 start_codon:yes stop_codon:yes gene_type:complete
MARKTLLTESEIRRFMKLASVQPLGAPNGSPMAEAGYPGARDIEGEIDVEEEQGGFGGEEAEDELEVGAVEDEGDEEVDVEMEVEEESPDMVSIDDFVAALEQAVEEVTGEPTTAEFDAGEEEEEEAPEEFDLEAEEDVETVGPEGGEVEEEEGMEVAGAMQESRKKKARSQKRRRLHEDSGEDQAWNDWKNEHADDDHIREMEHHLRALKEDRDYERHGAEYDHDKDEDEGYSRDESMRRQAIVNEVSRRVAARLTQQTRKDASADELANRILHRLTK